MVLSINQDPDVTMVLGGSTGCSELTLMFEGELAGSGPRLREAAPVEAQNNHLSYHLGPHPVL